MNNAAINTHVQVFIFLGYMPMSGISGPCSNSTFTLLRSCQTVFQSFPFCIPTSSVCRFQFLHILVNTYYYVFFITTILVDVKWLSHSLVCIFLMPGDIEHLFVAS